MLSCNCKISAVCECFSSIFLAFLPFFYLPSWSLFISVSDSLHISVPPFRSLALDQTRILKVAQSNLCCQQPVVSLTTLLLTLLMRNQVLFAVLSQLHLIPSLMFAARQLSSRRCSGSFFWYFLLARQINTETQLICYLWCVCVCVFELARLEIEWFESPSTGSSKRFGLNIWHELSLQLDRKI